MTEETRNAAISGSIGIVTSIGVSIALGLFLLLGLLFSIQDLDRTVNSPTGEPVAQIFLDTVGEKGAIVLMVRPPLFWICNCTDNLPKTVVVGAMFFCGTFAITSNSRMMYAFARDGGIPGHKLFHKVSRNSQTPIRTGASLHA